MEERRTSILKDYEIGSKEYSFVKNYPLVGYDSLDEMIDKLCKL